MTKRTAVIEDIDAFLEWLGTQPLIIASNGKMAGVTYELPPLEQVGKAKVAMSEEDKLFAQALKEMA